MKKLTTLIFAGVFAINAHAQFGLGSMLKSKVDQRANTQENKTMDNSLDTVQNGVTGKKNTPSNSKTAPGTQQQSKSDSASSGKGPVSYKAYNNYDFVSGNNILFEDNFQDTQDGEFPDHWNLIAGQGVVNKQGNKTVFLLTEGNYVRVNPLIKGKNYLSDPFTIEFDYYANSGYGMSVFLQTDQGERYIGFDNKGAVSTGSFTHDLSGEYPDKSTDFLNKWHHAAFIYKNKQIKCYVDQYRVLVVPNCGFMVDSLEFGGIGSQDNPITFTNVRIANGGNMNMLDQINTTGKFMTHAITFDVDKATIKPESMGFLNQLVSWLKTNATVKLEIDGYTDNTGAADHNQTLSQQRADAVKAQLITMGIDASRFTSKGFGAVKPISTNDTPEGRANNRRVELVKI
jgi:OmpA-OmpF porin, OOP family